MKTIFDSFCTVFAADAAAAAVRYIVSKTKGICARESTLAIAMGIGNGCDSGARHCTILSDDYF